MSDIGATLPLWSALPFAGMLLSIALMPLAAPHVWHRHYPRIAIGWALVFAVPFILVHGGEGAHELLHVGLVDYVPFLLLLGALFTVSGGIVLEGSLPGTPGGNVLLLLAGTVAASFLGTTGASMLFIRPVLRANAHRRRRAHVVVFFIFLVANIGGSLTPLGDPPLFLGFLHGVPFFWTLRLLPETAFLTAALLGIFWAVDRAVERRHPSPRPDGPPVPLRIRGGVNGLLLGAVVAAVLLSGLWHSGEVGILGVHLEVSGLARDAALLACAALSLLLTPRGLRQANGFSWAPIREVAWLFAGIFATIVPALAILRAGEAGALAPLIRAVRDPAQFFWATGLLSSFLDNAPTYLTFFGTALGRVGAGLPEPEALRLLLTGHADLLRAISAGAVFMGANTYIGNAPNFMVRSMAEEAGVAMPSFFGYLLRWSLPILVPLFMLQTVIFHR